MYKIDTKRLLCWDLKWKKLRKLSSFFAFFPFVEFVIVSGSMATGDVKEHSDFDVIVSVKKGRLFLTRYLLNMFFSLLGKRRKDDIKHSSPDKFCFNHFVTKNSWLLKPIDSYGPIIYKNLIPLWGNENKIREFLKINSIYKVGLEENIYDLRYNKKPQTLFAKFLERILGGKLGDYVEKISQLIALRRLNRYLSEKKAKRVIISDKELEFHFY